MNAYFRMFPGFQIFPHMLCIFMFLSACFRNFTLVPHISRISGPRTLVPYCFHICSAYLSTYFLHVSTIVSIFCAFPAAAQLFCMCLHVFRMCFTILSYENCIVFRIFSVFRICCAYLRASQNACLCISKFPNVTLRFHRLGVAI
jgi:hypothetical protein